MNYIENPKMDYTVRYKLNEVTELVSVALRNMCAADIVQTDARKTSLFVLNALLVTGTSFGAKTFRRLCADAELFDNRVIDDDSLLVKDWISAYQRRIKDGDFYKGLFVKGGANAHDAAPARAKVRERAADAFAKTIIEHSLSPDLAFSRMQMSGENANYNQMLAELMFAVAAITGVMYVHPVFVPLVQDDRRLYMRHAKKFYQSAMAGDLSGEWQTSSQPEEEPIVIEEFGEPPPVRTPKYTGPWFEPESTDLSEVYV